MHDILIGRHTKATDCFLPKHPAACQSTMAQFEPSSFEEQEG
jgi:hypothetical protein